MSGCKKGFWDRVVEFFLGLLTLLAIILLLIIFGKLGINFIGDQDLWGWLAMLALLIAVAALSIFEISRQYIDFKDKLEPIEPE